MKSLNDYKGILPYASELFGVYQPLVGWKSTIITRRYQQFNTELYRHTGINILSRVNAAIPNGSDVEDAAFNPENIRPSNFSKTVEGFVDSSIDSGIARLVQEELASVPPEDWHRHVNMDLMTKMLRQMFEIVTTQGELTKHPEIQEYFESVSERLLQKRSTPLIKNLFERESKIAGYLVYLAENTPKTLESLFFRPTKFAQLEQIKDSDPLLTFGSNLYKAILSPIGIIHLYREYFFEFDSFLGQPVGHLWLSPGGTVELIEVNTKKVFSEQTFESSTEMTNQSESEKDSTNEFSDVMKKENRNNIKFGFTNTASYTTPVFQDTAVASFSLDNSKMEARETTYKHMRQQSEKTASELKQNFKTTFKTSTDITDTSSKRYVIQNTSLKLVNYEMRRKMRKVGVQVQDIGVQLCWHTFVDDPAKELGIAKLVHIASPPNLGALKDPEELPMPEPEIKAQAISLNIQWPADDVRYFDFKPLHPPIPLIPPKPGYIYSRTELIVLPGGEPWAVMAFPANSEIDTILVHKGTLTHADVELIPTGDGATTERMVKTLLVGVNLGNYGIKTDSEYEWNLEVSLVWKPSQMLVRDIQNENKLRRDKFNAEKKELYAAALIKAAHDRIKLASKITTRPPEILREEERTVVYRQLISQLMKVGGTASKHVVSELVRSIFDIDKMLYFVAPEWWVPRLQHLHGSQQNLIEQPQFGFGKVKPQIPADNIVDWGGSKEKGRDNYYITEDSATAKLGSSLGWLIQLDGDNMRNMLLNSPWVKAVIPIRIGKEKEAINWLKQAGVEGNEGLDAQYFAVESDPDELKSSPTHTVTVMDALDHLIEEVNLFDQKARTTLVSNPGDPEDSSNHFAGSLPTEAVFEHGFYPLIGGVRFNQSGTDQAIVSQWTEILPTDQIATLEVQYNPKTLQIITPKDIESEAPVEEDE